MNAMPDFLPGDFACVSYLRPDFEQRAIAWASRGRYTHAFAIHKKFSDGKVLISQAMPSGVQWSLLDNYLIPQRARVLVRRLPALLGAQDRVAVCHKWSTQIGLPYSYDGDLGLGLLMIAGHLTGLHTIHSKFPNLLANPYQVFCSQHVVDGWQDVNCFMHLTENKASPELIAKTTDSGAYDFALWDGKKWQ